MKKKFISFVMAFMLLLVGGFTLAGCDEVPADPTTPPAGETTPTHTHEYVGDVYYTVSEGKAYTNTKCDCGDVKSEEITNAVIATPTTAQDVLDSNINGKVVVFDEGEYNTTLELRPSITTSDVYTIIAENKFDLGDAVAIDDIERDRLYNYVRNFENIVFAGTEGAIFNKGIWAESHVLYPGYLIAIGKQPYDAVKGITMTSEVGKGYYSRLNFKNVTFTNLYFEDSSICYITRNPLTMSENILVKNCTFKATAEYSAQAIYFDSTNAVIQYKNVQCINNIIDKYFQGIYVRHVENILVEKNEIKNTIHNAIAVQTATGGEVKGNIDILNNIVENCVGETQTGERAIRFGVCDNATIVIENNSFTSAVDSANELIKTEISTNTTYAFTNNTYGGVAVENKNGILDSTQWIYTLPAE